MLNIDNVTICDIENSRRIEKCIIFNFSLETITRHNVFNFPFSGFNALEVYAKVDVMLRNLNYHDNIIFVDDKDLSRAMIIAMIYLFQRRNMKKEDILDFFKDKLQDVNFLEQFKNYSA